MKSTLAIFMLWVAPMIATHADSEVIPVLVPDSPLTVAMADSPTVLWDECNMTPDRSGVLSCYRMLSDLTEQNYYYLDDREYAYYPETTSGNVQ